MKTLYFGGTIRTMEGGAAVEALLVEDGVIAAAGARAQLAPLARGALEVDLEGRTMLPAFLDAHSHLSGAAEALLHAPLDGADSPQALADALRRFLARGGAAADGWVVGIGYDQNRFAPPRHPTRALLDSVSTDRPVMVVHRSGHMGVFNTRALALLGVTADTPAPAGGRIEVEGGALTGLMEENAFLHYRQRVPPPAQDDLIDACRRAQRQYAAHGITLAQEGMMPAALLPLYRALAARDALLLDVVAYPSVADWEAAAAAFPNAVQRYSGHLKLGGCKIFLDGSPQGRTAWLRAPYSGASDGFCGSGTMTDAAVADALRFAAAHRLQLLAHCNGDAAAEQFLRAVEQLERTQPEFRALRPVMIHAQLLDVDQLPRLARTGVLPSFFPAHIYHWGENHCRNLGAARAARLSPAGTAHALGLPFTLHQDTPVLPPDPLEAVWCAVQRETAGGAVLGAAERIPVDAALRAVTAHVAYQYFEERTRGTLRAGKTADLVLLDGDPFTAAPDALRRIRVVETVKAGRSIYRAAR